MAALEKKDAVLRQRVLFVSSIIGIAYFGLVMLVLSLFDNDYSPIADAASDYGIGRFALPMNAGFFVAGVGFICFALAYASIKMKNKSRIGSAFLFFAGLVLIMDSYFTTNLPNEPATLHGNIHGFGGLLFFTSAPIGVLLVSRKQSRARFLATVLGLIIGFAILAAPLNAAGLAERIVLLVIFTSMIIFSLQLQKNCQSITIKRAGILR